MDMFPTVPLNVVPEMYGRYEVSCVMTIDSSPMVMPKIEVFDSGNWAAVYVDGKWHSAGVYSPDHNPDYLTREMHHAVDAWAKAAAALAG